MQEIYAIVKSSTIGLGGESHIIHVSTSKKEVEEMYDKLVQGCKDKENCRDNEEFVGEYRFGDEGIFFEVVRIPENSYKVEKKDVPRTVLKYNPLVYFTGEDLVEEIHRRGIINRDALYI